MLILCSVSNIFSFNSSQRFLEKIFPMTCYSSKRTLRQDLLIRKSSRQWFDRGGFFHWLCTTRFLLLRVHEGCQPLWRNFLDGFELLQLHLIPIVTSVWVDLNRGMICARLLTVPLLSIGYLNVIIQFLFLCLLFLEKYTFLSPTFHVLNVCITFSALLTKNKRSPCSFERASNKCRTGK